MPWVCGRYEITGGGEIKLSPGQRKGEVYKRN